MFRFLSSVILLQVVLAAVVYGAIASAHPYAPLAVGLFIFISAVLFSIWLKSLAELQAKDEIARHKEAFAKEREEIRVKAERDKLKVVKETQKQIKKETGRTNAKANFKVGAAVAGAVGVGALLVVGQMVTLGLLTLTTAGGGLAGYLVRARQERKLLPAGDQSRNEDALPKPKIISALGFDRGKTK